MAWSCAKKIEHSVNSGCALALQAGQFLGRRSHCLKFSYELILDFFPKRIRGILCPGEPKAFHLDVILEFVFGLFKPGKMIRVLMSCDEHIQYAARLFDNVLRNPGHEWTRVGCSIHNSAIDQNVKRRPVGLAK